MFEITFSLGINGKDCLIFVANVSKSTSAERFSRGIDVDWLMY